MAKQLSIIQLSFIILAIACCFVLDRFFKQTALISANYQLNSALGLGMGNKAENSLAIVLAGVVLLLVLATYNRKVLVLASDPINNQRERYKLRTLSTSAALLVAIGILSNLYDRLNFSGVIDYWHITLLGLTFSFNLADILVVLGIIGLWRLNLL